MNRHHMKNLIRIAYALVFVVTAFLISNQIFGWYTGKSNDAVANSNEIKTITTGYGGRFTTENDYQVHNDIYESADVVTKKQVKPGDVTFFTFIMEFDQTDGASLQGATYDVDLVINAGYVSNDIYHGVETGDYLSFLSNVTIPVNTATMAIAKRSYDTSANSYKYQQTTDYDRYSSSNTNTITNLAVTSFYENNIVSAVIRITFPTGMSYPSSTDDSSQDDGKIYFMIYLPIWYKDTNTLQNNEMNSYIKVGSIIYTKYTKVEE